MLSDYHLHSHFSGDCQVPMAEMIKQAIDLGLHRLCFTDHHDIDFPSETIDFTLDIPAYIKLLEQYKAQYSSSIQLLTGIELGMQMHLHQALDQVIKTYPFDFVIASQHLAQGQDVYQKDFFQSHTKKEGYDLYFQDMLNNITAFDNFDVYGHLDYIVRYGHFKDKSMKLEDYQDIIDSILKTLIEKGKGIEVNTSGYKYLGHRPHPHPDIIKRYYDLGGEIITLGSDAHLAANIASDFDIAKELLISLGFKYFTTFVERKPEFHRL